MSAPFFSRDNIGRERERQMKAAGVLAAGSYNQRMTASIARDLVEGVCALFESGNQFNADIIAAFRKAPTVKLFDRLTAFRSEPMDAENRAAIDRVERGEYGRCTTCGGVIGQAQLRSMPLLRYCSACLRELGSFDAGGMIRHPETHRHQQQV